LKLRSKRPHVGLGMSPPARGRGLKRFVALDILLAIRSPPARGRGLKRRPHFARSISSRRPPRGGVD